MPQRSDENAPNDLRTIAVPSTILAEIDRIDFRLIELLTHRCDLSRQAFAAAGSAGITGLMHAQSERIRRVVIESAGAESKCTMNSESEDTVANWLRHAASIGLENLHRSRVAYLGPRYSYSHLAAIEYFGDAAPTAALATIPAVFESIIRCDSQAGIVPIENSTDGRIVDTLGMFVRVDAKICGEVKLPIHHNLLSRSPREKIREVHSKPQALSQCRTWLANHLPGAKLVECGSTTTAAQLAASTPGLAAVASLEAARQYELDVIDSAIEDNPNNVTRFAILGREIAPPSGSDKTVILFQVRHQPGALADAMLVFKQANLNLTWIESFPLPQSSAEYLFFVETDGHATDECVAGALTKLRAMTLRLSIIGSYPRAASVN